MRRAALAAPGLAIVLAILACRAGMNNELGPIGYTPPSTKTATPVMMGGYAQDIAYLQKHARILELDAPGGGKVAVSPTFQGRVMTSTTRPGGPSFGWINRKFISDGRTGTAFDNYGGEDRFWLGPEGGQFGLFFSAGRPFTFPNWQTPPALQEGEWTVTEQSPTRIVFTRRMSVTNYLGTDFELTVTRAIAVLGADDVKTKFGATLPPGAEWVGFESVNTLTNAGQRPWTKEGGLLSIWILGMYAPSPDARVIVPFEQDGGDGGDEGAIVNDRYFGKVPPDRLTRKDSFFVFVCDGNLRSKIGLGPDHAKNVLGGYSAAQRLLTLVGYDKPKGPSPYVNSLWEVQKDPYGGDVVNSYNDGPAGDGKGSLGGFYEIETSSPAAALAPGESIAHTQRTLHVVGEPGQLDDLSRTVLGAPLDQVK
jgi:uncharacterized protein DUF6786